MSRIIVPLHLANLAAIPNGPIEANFKKLYLRADWVKLYNGITETDLVLDRPLDGFTATPGSVTSSDTVLTALEKLQYEISTINPILTLQDVVTNGSTYTDINGNVTTIGGGANFYSNASSTNYGYVGYDALEFQGSGGYSHFDSTYLSVSTGASVVQIDSSYPRLLFIHPTLGATNIYTNLTKNPLIDLNISLPATSGTLALTSNIPSVTPSALTRVNDTNITLTLGGTPATSLLQAVSLTLGWTGTLADSRIASASNWNTAYNNRITSLTTTGSSGSATLISNILNIPTYTLVGLGGVPTSRQLTINGTTYDLSADRSWTINSMIYPGAGIAVSTGTSWDTSITDNSANWNTAYTDRYKWDGGATGLVAATGRTSLGLGTFAVANYPTWVSGTPFVKMTAAGIFALDTNTYLTSAVTSVGATGPITSSGGNTPTISTSMSTNKLIGRTTAGTGVMEEISIGTGLTLTAGILSNSATYTSPLTTKGDIFVRSTADTRLPVGTDGQYLVADSTQTIGLKWQTLSLSGYVPYSSYGTNNVSANNFFDGFTSVVASGTLITLTVNSTPSYLVTGSGGQTIKLPDATTLPNGSDFYFNNNQSSGAILVNNNSNTLVKSVPSGGYLVLTLIDNSIAAGSWDAHFQAPSNVSWSTNTFDYAGSITSATWNGANVAINRGGTGSGTAAGARTNLGSTTVGDNLFTLTNPSAITFIRINADNTVSALGASSYLTAIGGQGATSRRNANNSTNSAINYCGVAQGSGVADSSATWTVYRLTVASDGTVVTATATNITWTSRESATYI